jgi:HAMP domain-containing protein
MSTNTLSERRQQVTMNIVKALYENDEEKAAGLALAVGLSDPEFGRLRDSVEKARAAVETVGRHERQRDEIEQARKMAEQALDGLAEKKRAFLAEIEAEASGHRSVLAEASSATNEAKSAWRVVRGLTGNIPGLLRVLPEVFQADHERRERAAAVAANERAKAKKRRAREQELQDVDEEIERLRDEANRFMGAAPTAAQIENSIAKLTKQRELLAEELKAND